MIIDEKKYELIVTALKEFSASGEEESFYTKRVVYNIFHKLIGGNYDLMVKNIENNQWSEFSPMNSNNIFGRNAVNKASIYFFTAIDKKLLGILQKVFIKNNMDFITELQEVIIQNYNTYNHEKLNISFSSAVIHQITTGTYLIDSNEKIKIINKMAEYFIERTQQDSHRMALTLVRILLETEKNPNNGLSKLKIFLDNNKTINPNASKELESIKEKIKDWDLSTNFTLAEKKMLYASEGGIVAKKVEGLFYDLDINLIKSKIKGKQKVTNTIIHSNINALLSQLPIALGNLESYVGVTCVNETPSVQINILFESGVNHDQMNAMNNLVETLITSKTKVDVKEVAKLIETTLFAAFLDAQLSKKETGVKRIKI